MMQSSALLSGGGTNKASMMQLPPSPEFAPLSLSAAAVPPLLQDDDEEMEERFRSIARYSTFEPQCMATTSVLQQQNKNNNNNSNSMTALAGPHGVLVFETRQFHKPLLMFRHETSTTIRDDEDAWAALQFYSTGSQELLLAAARGSGVLVWDASGNSLSPLLGRLSLSQGKQDHNSENVVVVDLDWKPNAAILATCTAGSASLWDLRENSSFRQTIKPCLRFANRQQGNSNVGSSYCPHVQIACDSNHQVALLDSGGTVRVYDVRMARNNSVGSGATFTFSAHGYAGVGLSSVSQHEDGGGWITWGLEEEETVGSQAATVKLWEPCKDDPTSTTGTPVSVDSDSYWFMDGSSERSPSSPKLLPPSKAIGGYKLAASKSLLGLACARPTLDGLVTVCCNAENYSLWQTDYWKVKEHGSNNEKELVNMASFSVDGSKDELLQTAMGGRTAGGIGSIRGAELAMVPRQQDGEQEVVLTCLTSGGYVVSHAIPEASPQHDSSEKQPIPVQPKMSPTRRTLQMVRSDAAFAPPPLFRGIYSGGSDVVSDPVSAWQQQYWRDGDGVWEAGETKLSDVGTSETQQQAVVQDDPITSMLARGVDGGMMQFDMDESHHQDLEAAPADASTSIQKDDVLMMADAVTASTAPISTITPVVMSIQPDKVPCPRLCGATFGSRGLVCFHNGEVRKMWSWYYQQSDATVKRRQQPILTATTSSPTVFSAETPDGNIEMSHRSENENTASQEREEVTAIQASPRTLEDLRNMTSAAKQAQWGDDNAAAGSQGNLDSESESSVEDIFDDDESFGGSNSSDSEDLNYLVSGKKGEKKDLDLYDSYFRGLQRPGTVPLSPGASDTASKSSSPPSSPLGRAGVGRRYRGSGSKGFGGPSSDLLTPIVRVTYEHDGLVLNGQCPELAEEWNLEDFSYDKGSVSKDVMSSTVSDRAYESAESEWGWEASNHSGNYAIFPEMAKAASFIDKKGNLIEGVTQVKSDTDLKVAHEPVHDQMVGPPILAGDDITVRGGESGVRPNRRESMVFLRKLFTTQKGGLITPPDAPMLPKSMATASNMKRSQSSNAILQTFRVEVAAAAVLEETKEEPNTSVHERKLGVFTRNLSFRGNSRVDTEKKLFRTMQICLENARVSNRLNQPDKARVWSLIAQMVDNVMKDDFDALNGWGSDGALGQELVASIFRHYEMQGDVQMLASIVCVLGRNLHTPDLLPRSQEEKYDSYIRRYAELLYGWGLLTIRAKVNKHLVRKPPGTEGEQLIPPEKGETTSAGVAFVPLCPRCRREAQPDSNVCSSCRDYAFRCSICTNAVRGLFTVCVLCGHGGHLNHLVQWFENHSACPSGCGCFCVMNTATSHAEDGISMPPVHTQQALPLNGMADTEMLNTDPGSIPFGGYMPESQ